MKDTTKVEHRHNRLYFRCCPNVTCSKIYVGETDRRIKERIMDHNKKAKGSHLLKHARESKHIHVWKVDLKILKGNYKSSIKRKISEALYVRTLKPTLNIKDLNCTTDLVAVILQLSSCINSTLIDFSLSFSYTIL